MERILRIGRAGIGRRDEGMPSGSRGRANKTALLAGVSLSGLLCSAPALAADWTGVIDNDWFTAGNWDGLAVPGVVDSAVVGVGTPEISGAAAQVDNASVGRHGDAELVISGAGSLVVTDTTLVGSFVGDTGTITVTGTGSSLTTKRLVLGYEGTGILNVSDGGLVTGSGGDEFIIGSAIPSHGTATFSGGGTKLDFTGSATIGEDGTGELSFLSGADGAADNTYLGFGTYGTGTLIVSGLGSTYDTDGFYVGIEGSGDVIVTDQGMLATTEVSIGQIENAEGKVTVNGGAFWSATGAIVVGSGGSGALNLSGGATVTIGTQLLIAEGVGSTGAVNIGGAEDEAAAPAGSLNAPIIAFGDGAGSLNFNHQNLFTPYILSSVITNTGSLARINNIAGTTRLTANSSGFSGTTTVSGGNLSVTGFLGGTLNVVGGMLSGTGTVGAVTAASGGTIAPGNSIGTLNVTSLVLDAGSTLAVEVDSGGNSDLLAASDGVMINGGTVNVIAYPDYVLSTPYTIITATNGVSGTFDGLAYSGISPFVIGTLTYNNNDVTLELNEVAPNGLPGMTPNQQAASDGVASLVLGNAVYDAILAQASVDDVKAAFDAVSGEIHASVKTALMDDSRYLREAALARLREALGGGVDAGMGVWLHGFGAVGSMDSDGNAGALGHATGGFFIGADAAPAGDWRFGALVGYSHSNFDVASRGSSGTADSLHLGAYGGAGWSDVALRFGGAYSLHDVGTERSIDFPGFSDELSAEYWAATGQVFGELAYRSSLGAAWFEPFANLAVVNQATGDVDEQGGAAALTGAGDVINATFTTLGLRAEMEIEATEGGRATLSGMAGWRHAMGDVAPTSTLAFAGGDAFTVTGAPVAREALVLEAGLDFVFSPMATLGIAYSGQLASGQSDHAVKATLGVRF